MDKRTAERLNLHLPVRYSIFLSDAVLTGRTVTTNLSGRGTIFRVPWRVSPNTDCFVTIQLPQSRESFSFDGRIVRCTRSRMASPRAQFTLAVEISGGQSDAAFMRYCHFIATQLLARYL